MPCGDGRLSGSAAGRRRPEYFRYFGRVFVTWVGVRVRRSDVGGDGSVKTLSYPTGRAISRSLAKNLWGRIG